MLRFCHAVRQPLSKRSIGSGTTRSSGTDPAGKLIKRFGGELRQSGGGLVLILSTRSPKNSPVSTASRDPREGVSPFRNRHRRIATRESAFAPIWGHYAASVSAGLYLLDDAVGCGRRRRDSVRASDQD